MANYGLGTLRKKTCLGQLGFGVGFAVLGSAMDKFLVGSLPPGTMTLAAGAVGGFIASIGSKVLVDTVKRWLPDKLPPDYSHKPNHDIERIVGHAITRVMAELVHRTSSHSALYTELLASNLPDHWHKLMVETDFEFTETEVPYPQALLIAAARARETGVGDDFPPCLTVPIWKDWLTRLDRKLETNKRFNDSWVFNAGKKEYALDELAGALVERFYWHVVEALKSDFEHDGKAFAAIQMATAASTLALVREERDKLAVLHLKLESIEEYIVTKARTFAGRLCPKDRRFFNNWFKTLDVKLILVQRTLDKHTDQHDRHEAKLDKLLAIMTKYEAAPAVIGQAAETPSPKENKALDAYLPHASAGERFRIAVTKQDHAAADAAESDALQHMKRRHEQDTFDVLMAQGRSRYNRNWFAAAQPFFTQALALRPADPDARWFEAACFQMPNPPADLLERAGRLFEEEAWEGSADARSSYALFLTSIRKDHDAAEAMHRAALIANPKHVMAVNNYANFLTSIRKDHDAAEAMYRRALAVDANHAIALGNYAHFLTDIRKDHEAADRMYQLALAAQPIHASAINNYATFLKNIRKDHDTAEAIYQQALAADPDHANTLTNYATFLQKIRKNHDAAEAMHKRALAVDANHAIALGNYANFLKDIHKDHDTADRMYKRTLAIDPNHATNLGNYAFYLTGIRKDHAAAEAMYQRALASDPNHANALGNYAQFLKTVRKDHDAAERLYKRALAADPQDPNALCNYANFLKDVRKNYEDAETMYQRALKSGPNHADALGNYALFLAAIRQDYDAAERLFERALTADPNHGGTLFNYVLMLLSQGRTDEARKHLVELRTLADSDDTTMQMLARCMVDYLVLGDVDGTESLSQIKRRISGSSTRCAGRDFSALIARAVELGHPQKERLPALAEVVAGRAEPNTLNGWADWVAA